MTRYVKGKAPWEKNIIRNKPHFKPGTPLRPDQVGVALGRVLSPKIERPPWFVSPSRSFPLVLLEEFPLIEIYGIRRTGDEIFAEVSETGGEDITRRKVWIESDMPPHINIMIDDTFISVLLQKPAGAEKFRFGYLGRPLTLEEIGTLLRDANKVEFQSSAFKRKCSAEVLSFAEADFLEVLGIQLQKGMTVAKVFVRGPDSPYIYRSQVLVDTKGRRYFHYSPRNGTPYRIMLDE